MWMISYLIMIKIKCNIKVGNMNDFITYYLDLK